MSPAPPANVTIPDVQILSDSAFADWDAYVRNHALGTPFHLAAWREAIEESFGYEPRYLIAADHGHTVGVLPLFLVKSIFTKSALISTPFAVYGGILADTPEVARALYDSANALGEQLGVQYIEYRNAYTEQCVGPPNVERYVTFRQTIGKTDEEILQNIPRKTRYMVRKAAKQPFTVQTTKATSRFYDLYTANLGRLGTPAFPRRYFESLIRHFGADVDIREYELDGKLASAVLTFYFRDQILPYYGATEPAFNAHAPTNFMYYDQMCWGAHNGFRTFDFGRSRKGSGSYDFKAHWGMEERPLPYEVVLIRQRQLPNFSPANPRFRLAIDIWKRLPLWLTRFIGPRLIRLVP